MSLQDPTKKMSKSDENQENNVALLDPPKVVRKKLRSAVTDSGTEIRYDEAKPGIANLLTMYAVLTDQTMSEAEAHFEGKMYGHLKDELADVMIAALEPIQQRYQQIMSDKAYLDGILAKGAEDCQRRARRTLPKVYRRVGLVEPARR